MSTLTERLHDLADAAPEGAGADDLWRRGRREHHVRRAGVGVIVAGALVCLGVVLGTWRPQDAPSPGPAAARAGAVLPDEIFEPSPWLSGTDDEGPLGQLVAVVPAERGGWTGSTPGVVGISATTQEYRYLDLPAYDGRTTALSPDGRRVAWWTTGDPSGTPNTGFGPSYTGYATYDTVTGDVERHAVATEHGLDPRALAWGDDDLLLAEFGQLRTGDDGAEPERSMSTSSHLEAWRPGQEPVLLPTGKDGTFESTAGDGRVLVSLDGGGYAVLDAETGRETATFDPGPVTSVVLSPGGGRFAAQVGTDTPTSVSIGTVGTASAPRAVPGTGASYDLVGWAGADAVVAVTDPPDGGVGSRLVRVAPDGTSLEETRLPGTMGPQDVSIAADLLAAPVVSAEEPATPLDPRVLPGLGLAAAVLAGLALLVWRRRRVRLR